jgi:hypothetical protein
LLDLQFVGPQHHRFAVAAWCAKTSSAPANASVAAAENSTTSG